MPNHGNNIYTPYLLVSHAYLHSSYDPVNGVQSARELTRLTPFQLSISSATVVVFSLPAKVSDFGIYMILSGSVGQSSPNRGAETSKQSLYINMGRLDSYRLLTRAILLLLVTEQLSFSGAFRPINSHIQSKLPDAVRIGAGALTLSKAIVPTYMQGFLESIPSEEIDPVFTNITNQQCISHVQYIMKELSSAVQIPPKIPETFILQSKFF